MKRNIIAALAITTSLLMSGCASHRQVAQQVTTRSVSNVSVCRFMFFSQGQTFDAHDITLITYSDGSEDLKFNSGVTKPVYRKEYSKSINTMEHFIKDYAKNGALIVGMAHHCM